MRTLQKSYAGLYLGSNIKCNNINISVVSHRNTKCDFMLCITLALLMEFIQLSHYVLLTFDWTDVLVQLLGALAAFLCLQPFLPNK